MVLGVYATLLAVCGTSLVFGTALNTLTRPEPWRWPSTAVGFAALLVLCHLAVRLPGDAWTAAGLVLAGIALSVLRLGRTRDLRAAAIGAPVALVVVALASLPFIANARMGVLGQGFNNDMSFHLVWAEALTRGESASNLQPGYPLGPHSVVAVFSVALGVRVESAFLGLLLSVPVLTALTALGGLERLSPTRRLVGASLVGLPYLAAAYLAQASFKEPILALLLLAFVLMLAEVAGGQGVGSRSAVALGLLLAAGVYSFSYTAIAWPVAATAAAVAASAIGASRASLGPALRRSAWPLAAAAVGALLLAAPELDSIADFMSSATNRIGTSSGGEPGGNYFGTLSRFEVLGVWPHFDFRQSPPRYDQWRYLFVPLMIGVTLYALVWWWRRGDRVVPAAVVAGLVLHEVSRRVSIPYVSGKALVIIAPLIMLTVVGALLEHPQTSGHRRVTRSVARWIGPAFVLAAGLCSGLALAGAAVRPAERADELRELGVLAQGQPVLFLGSDEFSIWELRRSALAGFDGYRQKQILPVRVEKQGPGEPGPFDFDSLPAPFLNAFRFVVTPRTAYASEPADNFRLVRRLRWYALWKRIGPTQDRRVLREGEAPGLALDCDRGPRASEDHLLARTRAAPIVSDPGRWTQAGGATEHDAYGFAVLHGGQAITQTLELPAGRWELSLPYTSPGALDVDVTAAGRSMASSPAANLGDPTSFWRLGTIRADGGPVRVRVSLTRPLLQPWRQAVLGAVAATPLGDTKRVMTLDRACRRYVDWYGEPRDSQGRAGAAADK